jgi:hypothetical protein
LGVLGAAVAVALLVAGGIAFLDDGPRPTAGAREPGVIIDGGDIVLPEPLPVDCPELDDAVERFEAIDEETPAANPALLSDPPALPEGYSISVEDDILVGSDPNVSMSVSAGNPPPVEILGRSLHGPLVVTMRAWVYASADDAGSAGMSVLRDAVCTYDIEPFDVPDRPDVLGSTVSGIIPTTAFASWRLAERRFTVAVEAGADGDPDATAAAQQLAGTIAAMELDAARTAPAG